MTLVTVVVYAGCYPLTIALVSCGEQLHESFEYMMKC